MQRVLQTGYYFSWPRPLCCPLDSSRSATLSPTPTKQTLLQARIGPGRPRKSRCSALPCRSQNRWPHCSQAVLRPCYARCAVPSPHHPPVRVLPRQQAGEEELAPRGQPDLDGVGEPHVLPPVHAHHILRQAAKRAGRRAAGRATVSQRRGLLFAGRPKPCLPALRPLSLPECPQHLRMPRRICATQQKSAQQARCDAAPSQQTAGRPPRTPPHPPLYTCTSHPNPRPPSTSPPTCRGTVYFLRYPNRLQ